jgi:endonuclease YncB( thermonuclease family)
VVVNGSVDRVIDGDTFVAHLDILPGLELHGMHVRIQGINAPELSTAEGKVAASFAETLLPIGTSFVLTTTQRDKYGRVLGRVVVNGVDYGEQMIKSGHAVVMK